MTDQTDRIEREVVIAAPVERVWELVTSAEHLGRWFGDVGADVDLHPGGAMSVRWREHTMHARVEAVEPPHRFSYRWLSPGAGRAEATPANSTLVEFTLAAEGDHTRVAVVESGFDALAELDVAERASRFAAHVHGWTAELDELAAYAPRVPVGR